MWLCVPFGRRACTRRRLGRWMLFVLMFEWLTLLATRRCLPQTSHCAAISIPSGRRVPLAPADGNRKQAPRGYRGLAALAYVLDPARLPLAAYAAVRDATRKHGAGPNGVAERQRRGPACPGRA